MFKLRSVELTNFRRFASLTVPLDDELTVLVARNGGGKTAILDAIALLLSHGYVGPVAGQTRLAWSDSDHLKRRVSEQSFNVENAAGAASSGGMFVTDSDGDRECRVDNTSTLQSGIGSMFTLANRLRDHVGRDPNITLPVIAYYGTGRRMGSGHVAGHGSPEDASRFSAYDECLESRSSYEQLLQRFANWYRVTSDAKIRAMENEEAYEPSIFDVFMQVVRQAVDTCMQPTGWHSMSFSVTQQTLTMRHDELGEHPVGTLSEGSRAVLALVADIAFRCAVLNPHLGHEAFNSPGIVLIDEIDMHLHVEWQQSILVALRQAFPHIQWVVTTHSPQVLSTVPASQIRVIPEIGSDETEARAPEFSPIARPSVDSLEFILETSSVPRVGPLAELAEARSVYEYEAERGRQDSPRATRAKQVLDEAGYVLEGYELAAMQLKAKHKVHGADCD